MNVEVSNVSTPNAQAQLLSDDEIVADLSRLARTGCYLKFEPNDHGGYASEYKRQRTTKRGSQFATDTN